MSGTGTELIRVMALHSWEYCRRLCYLEEVEEIRIADGNVYAGRSLHEKIAEEEDTEQLTLQLSSELIGLCGRLDAIRTRSGQTYPYEHKRGRSKEIDREPGAWSSDRLQIGGYAMLLEEHLGEPVAEGRIRYHRDNKLVHVPINAGLRADVLAAVERIRRLKSRDERPPVCDNDRLCLYCSLAPECLPEETRRSEETQWDTVRLFPAKSDRQVVHVTESGSKVGRSRDSLKIRNREGQHKVSAEQVRDLVIHGYAQVTAQALTLCMAKNISVHWLSYGGRYVGGMRSPQSTVQKRNLQYDAMQNEEMCLSLARKIAASKAQNQLRFLLRAATRTLELGVDEGD